MKPANNNEVDLLLRSLAKKRAESAMAGSRAVAGDGDAVFSAHLDTDELNSYAEGVVPAPARARYTQHLADCDSCRRLMVELAQAAGIAVRDEAPQPERGLTFWQKLTELLSPGVLRYALPALMLAVVMGIGLFALRQPPQSQMIARNEPTEKQAAGSAPSARELEQTKTASATASPATVERPATGKGNESPAISDSVDAKKNPQPEKSAADLPAATSGGDFGNTAVAKDGSKAGRTDSLDDLRPYAVEPKAAPPAPPAGALSEADKSLTIAKEQPSKREGQQQRQRDEDFRNQPGAEHGPNRSASQRSGGAPLATRSANEVNAERRPDDESRKSKAAEETRTVSGRRFAREGNSWVDTNYDPSRSTIKLARGSEQFRALVADEPGLRAIANQLDGVVIVVWKNRAYRIQ